MARNPTRPQPRRTGRQSPRRAAGQEPRLSDRRDPHRTPRRNERRTDADPFLSTIRNHRLTYLVLIALVVVTVVVATQVRSHSLAQDQTSGQAQQQEEAQSQDQAQGQGDSQDSQSEADTKAQGDPSASEAKVDVDSFTLAATSTSGGLTESDLDGVAQALRDLGQKGIHPAISLETFDGSLTVSYNENTSYYTASSIKALYVTALMEKKVDTGSVSYANIQAPVEAAIIYSDNASYEKLRSSYGSEVLSQWMRDHDVPAGVYESVEDYAETGYPRSTSAQLLAAWKAIYAYTSSGKGKGATLADLLTRREKSPIREALATEDGAGDVMTMSKAGWYPLTDGQQVNPATNDAGVVIREGNDRGSYTLAVMSDADADLDALEPLVKSLDRLVCAHQQ